MSKYLLLFVLALGGCSEPSHTPSDRSVSTIQVEWLQPSQVNQKCREIGYKGGEVEGCAAVSSTRCTIYAPMPKSFNDKAGLQLLGHEAWHCFGAKHREP